MAYQKVNVYRVEYTINGKRETRHIRGDERKEQFVKQAKELGVAYKALKCYPINMERNQHNFELVFNICENEMCDMNDGVVPFDETEYEMLQQAKADAEKFFCSYGMFNSPISWFVWDDWKRAKELIAWAHNHRMDACEKAGVPYVGYI